MEGTRFYLCEKRCWTLLATTKTLHIVYSISKQKTTMSDWPRTDQRQREYI